MDLLPHNKNAYEAVISHLQKSDRTCVIHPTGTGKSYIALQIIEDNPDARILYVTSVATNLLEFWDKVDMTFTALIASVSHILIHPAILLEKWDVMLLCIVVATTASLASARFANRVDNRTVGLVTGAVLTILGGSMLLLKFWPQISSLQLASQTLEAMRAFGGMR